MGTHKDFYVYFFGFARIFHGFIINRCYININCHRKLTKAN